LTLFIGHNIATKNIFVYRTEGQEIVRARVTNVISNSAANTIANTIDRFTHSIDALGDFFEFTDDDYNHDFNSTAFNGSQFFQQLGTTTMFEAKITSGRRQGETLNAMQSFTPLTQDRSKEVKAGDKILIIQVGNDWYFNGYLRTNKLLFLGALLALCVLFLGGKKGFNALIALVFTCAAVFAVFIPSVLSGKNIYLAAIMVCIYTVVMNLLIVIGFNKKSFGAAIGCISGILAAGLITLIMNRTLFLTGIIDEHTRHLISLPLASPINLRALIFSGIIIGAMGALLDVAVSISSALWEIKQRAKNILFKELFSSGLAIGRDIMGTMINTLVLAYTGASLTLVLLLSVYSDSLLDLFNSEMIVVEILQALAGTLGILLTIPLTAFFCAALYSKKFVL
jgi:uncharacterized membrane protein